LTPGGARGQEPVPQRGHPITFTQFYDVGQLAGRFILDFTFDTDGTVWLATSDGVRRFDGYEWTQYGVEEGLQSSHARAVMTTADGQVWVGTENGIALWTDGRFTAITSPAQEQMNVRRMRSTPDDALWVAADKWLTPGRTGGLYEHRDRKWTRYSTASGLPTDYVSDFFEDSRGKRFALTSKGLSEQVGNRWVDAFRGSELEGLPDYAWSMAETPSGELLAVVGTTLAARKPRQRWRRLGTMGTGRDKPNLLVTEAGAVLRFHKGRFQELEENKWLDRSDSIPLPSGIEVLRESPDGSIWGGGLAGSVRWAPNGSRQFYPTTNGRVSSSGDGVLWVTGLGSTRRFDGEWSIHPELDGFDITGRWARKREDDGSASLIDLKSLDRRRISVPARPLRVDPLKMRLAETGAIWAFGRSPDGRPEVHFLENGTWLARPIGSAEETIQNGMATPSGALAVILHNQPQETARFVEVGRVGGEFQSRSFSLGDVPFHLRAQWRVRTDESGRTWISGDFGLIGGSFEEGFARIDSLPSRFIANVISRGEETWFVGLGRLGGVSALSRFSHGAWTHFPLDVTAFAGKGASGELFFRGRDRAYEVVDEPDAVPVSISVPNPRAVRSIARDVNGRLWITQPDGLIRISPDGTPPETRIELVRARVTPPGTILATILINERFRTARSGFPMFSYRLDSGEWSDYSEGTTLSLPTSGLSFGSHLLEVRSRDETREVDPTAAVATFTVVPVALQRRWWFAPLLLSLLSLLVGLSVVVWISRRKISHHARHLEAEVGARTADLEASLAEKGLLVTEIHHRVKNNLQVVASLLSLQESRIADESARRAVADSRSRVHAMALVHELLYRGLDSGELCLEQCVTRLLEEVQQIHASPERTVEVHVDIDEVNLDIAVAMPCGLILNELISNAFEHAFVGRASGTIWLEVENTPSEMTITVRDDGLGFDQEEALDHRSLGLKLVQVLAEQLGGSHSVRSAGGTEHRLVMPRTNGPPPAAHSITHM
jgi:two-component sensor histidine kinase